MKELAAVRMLANCSGSGGRGDHPSNASVARRLWPKERERMVAWLRAAKGGTPNSRGTQLATRWGRVGPERELPKKGLRDLRVLDLEREPAWDGMGVEGLRTKNTESD